MVDEDRRRFLKQLGAATTLTAAAGCLDGGESNGTPTDNGSSTPTPGQETDGQPDGDQAPDQDEPTEDNTGQSNDAFSTLDYLPATSELSDLSDSGDTPAVTDISHGYPAAMAETFSSNAVSTYEENGWVVPGWAGFGLADVDEKASFTGVASGASIYKVSDDATVQIEGGEQIGEIGGMDLYELTREDQDPDTVLAGDNYVIASFYPPTNENIRTLLARMVETKEGERPAYMDEEPLGDVWSDIDYDELIKATVGGPSVDLGADQLAEAANHDFAADSLKAQQGIIYDDGTFQVNSEQTVEVSQGTYATQWMSR